MRVPASTYRLQITETFDLFEPKGRSRVPHALVVFIHGGYWRSLDKSMFSWLAAS